MFYLDHHHIHRGCTDCRSKDSVW